MFGLVVEIFLHLETKCIFNHKSCERWPKGEQIVQTVLLYHPICWGCHQCHQCTCAMILYVTGTLRGPHHWKYDIYSPQVQYGTRWGTTFPHHYTLYLKVVGTIKHKEMLLVKMNSNKSRTKWLYPSWSLLLCCKKVLIPEVPILYYVGCCSKGPPSQVLLAICFLGYAYPQSFDIL